MMTSACCPLPRPLNAITLNLSYYSFTLFVCVCTTFARIGLWLWLKLIAHEVIEFHRTQVERGRGREGEGVGDGAAEGKEGGRLFRVINEIAATWLHLPQFASVSERLTWFMAPFPSASTLSLPSCSVTT